MKSFFSIRERLLFTQEVKGFFYHRRSLHVALLLPAGMLMMAWIYPVGSPFAAIFILVITGLELQFNNIFFRSPKELEAMSMFPISWERIVLVKNLATIALTFMLLLVVSMALLYFSPEQITLRHLGDAVCYYSAVLFPLLYLGNSQSVQQPRRNSGLRLDDMIEAIWMLVNLFLISIPSFIFIGMMNIPWLCLIYGCVTAIVWYRVSIPKTGSRINAERVVLCESL